MKKGVLSITLTSMLLIFAVTNPSPAIAKHIFGIGHIKIDPLILIPFVGPTIIAAKAAEEAAKIDPIVLVPFVGPTIAAAKAADAVAKAAGVETQFESKIYNEVAAYGNLTTDALKAIVSLDVNELIRIGIAAIARTGFLNPLTDILFYAAYSEYISNSVVDPNSPTIRLNPDFIAIYEDDFKQNLRNVTMRESKLDSTSLVDCDIIYFRRGTVATNVFAQIRTNDVSGTPFGASFNVQGSQLKLLLHELEHIDQCKEVGGRRQYALNWFYNLIISGIIQPAILVLAGPLSVVGGPAAYLATVDEDTIHDAQPLELKAERRSIELGEKHLTP